MNVKIKSLASPVIHGINVATMIAVFCAIDFEWGRKTRPITESAASLVVSAAFLLGIVFDIGFAASVRDRNTRILCLRWCALQVVLLGYVLLWAWGRSA
jgi:hypothetical protein